MSIPHAIPDAVHDCAAYSAAAHSSDAHGAAASPWMHVPRSVHHPQPGVAAHAAHDVWLHGGGPVVPCPSSAHRSGSGAAAPGTSTSPWKLPHASGATPRCRVHTRTCSASVAANPAPPSKASSRSAPNGAKLARSGRSAGARAAAGLPASAKADAAASAAAAAAAAPSSREASRYGVRSRGAAAAAAVR